MTIYITIAIAEKHRASYHDKMHCIDADRMVIGVFDSKDKARQAGEYFLHNSIGYQIYIQPFKLNEVR